MNNHEVNAALAALRDAADKLWTLSEEQGTSELGKIARQGMYDCNTSLQRVIDSARKAGYQA